MIRKGIRKVMRKAMQTLTGREEPRQEIRTRKRKKECATKGIRCRRS